MTITPTASGGGSGFAKKAGKPHDMPAHHNAEAYLDAYVQAAGMADQKREPLFRSAVGKTKMLSNQRMTRHAALKMIQRRALEAGINTPVCCHSFRATGITNYLTNGGTLGKSPADGLPRVGQDDQTL